MHSSFYKIDENVSSRMSQLFRRWLSDGLLASQFSFFQGFSFLPARLGQSNNFTGTSLLGLIITKVKASIGTKFSSKLFAMFKLANVNLYYGGEIQFTWRLAIVIAFVSSCLNSVGHTFALSLSIPDYNIFVEISKFVVGDVLGTFVTFLVGMHILRIIRLQKGF